MSSCQIKPSAAVTFIAETEREREKNTRREFWNAVGKEAITREGTSQIKNTALSQGSPNMSAFRGVQSKLQNRGPKVLPLDSKLYIHAKTINT